MGYKLLKFRKNYADEFDVHGIKVMSDKEYDEFVTGIKKYFDNHEVSEMYFGSNEYLDFTSLEDVERCLTVVDISDVHSAIRNILGDSFGWFPEFDEY